MVFCNRKYRGVGSQRYSWLDPKGLERDSYHSGCEPTEVCRAGVLYQVFKCDFLQKLSDIQGVTMPKTQKGNIICLIITALLLSTTFRYSTLSPSLTKVTPNPKLYDPLSTVSPTTARKIPNPSKASIKISSINISTASSILLTLSSSVNHPNIVKNSTRF